MSDSRKTFSPLGLTALTVLGLAASTPLAAHAQTDISGVYTGVDGPSATGTGAPINPGDPNFLFTGFSGTGLVLSGGQYHIHDATVTGGHGGTGTGTTGAAEVVGGIGGLGLETQADVTIAGGTFRGGDGGGAGGVGSMYINGGDGSNGYDVDGGTSVINGGTFRGGDSAAGVGTAPTLYGGRAGYGMSVGTDGVVTINGGTFLGGNGPGVTNPGGSAFDGPPASAVEAWGTVNIYGGTFSPGVYTAMGAHGVQSHYYDFGLDVTLGTVTLYGSSFTVNGVSNFTGSVPIGSGTITAQLQNNAAPTTFTYDLVNFYGDRHGSLVLVSSAPEPTQSAGLGLGALGLAGLALKARRRRSAF